MNIVFVAMVLLAGATSLVLLVGDIIWEVKRLRRLRSYKKRCAKM